MGKTFLTNRPELKYINTLLGLRCFIDLLKWELFPNAKEMTESHGAFMGIEKLGLDIKNPDMHCIVVGDGNTPRTAGYLATRTKWKCMSIDPLLKQDKIPFWESNIRNLACVPKRVEELAPIFVENMVIVSVHSHAYAKHILQHLLAVNRSLVSIPCCVKQHYDGKPDFSYEDLSIWSGKRKVELWKRI